MSFSTSKAKKTRVIFDFLESGRRRVRPAVKLALEPSQSDAEFTANIGYGHLNHFRRFLGRETAEEPHLQQTGFAGILPFERVERVIEGDGDGRALQNGITRLIERALRFGSTAFDGVPLAGMIDENLPHHLGGHSEKMRAALIIRLLLT
jgi:hypothetical protein